MRVQDLREAANTLTSDLGLLNVGGFFSLWRLDEQFSEALDELDFDKLEECVVGALAWGESIHGSELTVKSVWAKKGYGPLLYEILMTIAGSDGATPHETKVSPQAQKVWQRFLQREDVKTKPKTTNPESFQDYIYYLTDSTLGIKSAEKRLQRFLQPDPYEEKHTAILEVSDLFLSRTMNKMYEGVLQEKVEYLESGEKVIINPNLQQMKQIWREEKEPRALLDVNNNLYVWEGFDAIHQDAIEDLGLDPDALGLFLLPNKVEVSFGRGFDPEEGELESIELLIKENKHIRRIYGNNVNVDMQVF